MTVQSITLVTLGVADMARARAFYEALGWQRHPESQEAVTFYQANGFALGLFGLEDLAKDQGRPGATLGTGASTLAQNFATKAEVDAAYRPRAGGRGNAAEGAGKGVLGRLFGLFRGPRRPCLGTGDEPVLAPERRRQPDAAGCTLTGSRRALMTLTFAQAALYTGALFVLFLTPGPVWLALTARVLAHGMGAVLPLILGVALGDMAWSLLAVLGLSWVVQAHAGVMVALRWLAVAVFALMGLMLIRHAERGIEADSRLNRKGHWAGFVAGLAAILANPKAILFYMGMLPGFFDLTALAPADIAAIAGISMAVPIVGNLIFASFIDRARRLITSPGALATTNRIAGGLLIGVAAIIALT